MSQYARYPATGGGGGSGTVTSVSVVSANGLAGSVANATTTPAITLSTTITGVIKGNGTALSAAVVGTDYSVGTSALATGILKSTTATGALSIAVAGDFPALPYASSTLTSAHLFVGNGSNVATDVAVSGDLTLANTGAFTVATVGGASAANIASATALAIAATSADTADTIVKRDGSKTFVIDQINGPTSGNLDMTVASLFFGNSGFNCQDQIVYDLAGSNPSIDWGLRQLSDGSAPTVDWENQQLIDQFSLGSKSLDWGSSQLIATSDGAISINWSSRACYDNSNIASVAWNARSLLDAASALSVDWGNRTLNDSNEDPAMSWDTTGITASLGNIVINTAGKGLKIKEGSNARMGVATLVGGASVVSNTSVTANTRIFLTIQSPGGTLGTVYVSARTANTSFTISSTSVIDTSVVAWLLIEPA